MSTQAPSAPSSIAEELLIDRPTFELLVERAWSDYPFEVCGILGRKADGQFEHFPITNIERSMTNYTMEPREQFLAMRDIEDAGWELLLYHSHTHTQAYPSETDRRLAAYPEATYLIVTLQDRDAPDVRAFRLLDGEVFERAVRLVD